MLIGPSASDHRARTPTQCSILPFPCHPSYPRKQFAVGESPRLLATVFALVLAATGEAQTHPQPELRADVSGPSPYSVQPGVGGTIALGTYARAGAAVGYAIRNDSTEIADRWRIDLLGRFLFDPFGQRRWALSVGGGVSVRRRVYLAALVDLEGPALAGWRPAVQGGVSGGLRGGIVVRRAIQGRR